jgi:hypothetical protein
MKEKPSIEEKQTMSEKDKAPILEMADQAMKNYEQALKTGLKLQEEAGRYWGGLFNQNASTQDWQKRFLGFAGVANSLAPAHQKRMEEVLDLVEKNTRSSADLMKKAVDAAQTPVIAESQSKWLDVWISSLGAARSNAEAVTQIGGRAIDSWIEFVQKNTEVTEVRVPKTA